MKNDETFMEGDELGTQQLKQLDQVIGRVIITLETGRDDLFEISQDCHQQSEKRELELEQLKVEMSQVIRQVDQYESQERLARIRLMEVSRNFHTHSEEDIKDAYENARLIQVTLMDLRQKELYLRRRRDELGRQIKQLGTIAGKADRLLSNTTLALKLLMGNVDKISGALEGAARRQQMEMWIIESQEAERRKIARDLHDGPAQSLASMLIRLDLIERLAGDDSTSFFEELNKAKDMGRESLADIRRIMFDLKPTLMHEDGFISTLRDYFNNYEAKYNFDIAFTVLGNIRKYDLSLEIALFRMVQEAITNARKHANVDRVQVKIEDNGKSLTLIVKDEGTGFDIGQEKTKQESYGIMGMKERVELFGGQLDIISEPGSGTQVVIKVPLEREVGYGQNKGSDSR
ncbi:MAG TPA: sensor histidine kinase [Syntrophomonadaceae bacterium]|nr:sensor histidine kinase [Syntrophomonadaceae bacterium]